MTESSAQGPEFLAGELTGARLLDTIETSGAAVIRRCLDPAQVQAMLTRAEAVYQEKELAYRRGELSPAQRTLFEFGHLAQSDLDLPNAPFAVIKLLLRSNLYPLLADLWGGKLAFLRNNCLPRRQSAGAAINPVVPFHQDAAFLATTVPVLNFWIPLVSCGIDAPGLEVVLGNPRALLRDHAVKASKDYREIEITEADILARYGGDRLWRPVLASGDLLVFSSMTIHRTHVTPAMIRSRISLEVRCGDAGNAELRAARNDLVEVKFHDKAVA
ncbi:MAG: phytanoyl-CoA dioxygenase family protein [Alphaproteobacteria bacterium]|nr:phytanoyl-CoA dioxygenase family protein [Alphaproteobacteria bacterium]